VLAQALQPGAEPITTAVIVPKWMTQEVAGQWRASKLIGLNVYNHDNEKIGGITELVVDKSGKLDAVVVGAGGFLGLGEHDVAIPYSQITWMLLPGAQSPANPTSSGAASTADRTSEGAHPSKASGGDRGWQRLGGKFGRAQLPVPGQKRSRFWMV
jgi:sporulation protein YlmC with PRC-barrel domain